MIIPKINLRVPRYVIVIFIFLTGIIACKKALLDADFAGFSNPKHFPSPTYHFETNNITKEGFVLGRKLFYEKMLSANNTISCANCHIQSAAFSHNGHSVSHGIHDLLGTRNSPAIMNLAWSKTFMWDGGIFDLDLQPVAPITNRVEMDEHLENVLNKLSASPVYPVMFEKAFGSTEITSARLLKALSQFMLMCVSDKSKYDSVQLGTGAVFTMEENEGYLLFKQKCNSCHTEPLFTDNSFRNNGILQTNINDSGRGKVTLQASDVYTFKVPSLRNLSFTVPYMHDGRFFTLEEVLDHYANHVQPTPNLDPLLQQGTNLGISLTTVQRQQIIAFLKTLDDHAFVRNPDLSEQ
jgi:cytochrome c peroxidase